MASSSATGMPVSRPASEVLRGWDLGVAALVAYGLLTALLGIAVLVWPQATLYVIVLLFAIQVFVLGVVQIARAAAIPDLGGGTRALLAIGGALSLLIGLLVLRSPLQTLVVIALLFGAWWVLTGVFDIVSAFSGSAMSRGWSLLMGAISVIAGVIVLLQPEISLAVLIVVLSVWMIVYGVMTVVGAFILRRAL